jgi:hypothetical protein
VTGSHTRRTANAMAPVAAAEPVSFPPRNQSSSEVPVFGADAIEPDDMDALGPVLDSTGRARDNLVFVLA